MLDASMRALLPDLVGASDTGFSNSDNVTSDRTPVLTGTVRGEATQVRLFIDGRRGDLVLVSVLVPPGTHSASSSGRFAAASFAPH